MSAWLVSNMTLRYVEVSNYKKFPKFRVSLRSGNVLVGPNNAGKSSVLDAFRLLEACRRSFRRRRPIPINVDGQGVFYGHEVPDSALPFRLENITHNYSSEDAVVLFGHENGAKLVMRLHPERATRIYLDNTSGGAPNTPAKFAKAFPLEMKIVPTLAPFEVEERYVRDETVQKNDGTRLAARVFRNIWLRKSPKDFQEFASEVARAWPGVNVQPPEAQYGQESIVQMFFEENRIIREVNWAGFGFQAWLQLYTHMLSAGEDAILVIDEPDVYLHPDLQSRLMAFIHSRFKQFIVATHASEIINGVKTSAVVSVNPRYQSAKRVVSDGDYSELFRYIGSSENADFARVAKSKSVLFVEGLDGRLLHRFAAALNLFPLSSQSEVAIAKIGGFSEYRKATDAVWAFKEIVDLDISAFCLFDRDYRSREQVQRFLDQKKPSGLEWEVLDRKEIENYLLESGPIARAVNLRLKKKGEQQAVCESQIEDIILDFAKAEQHAIAGQLVSNALKTKISSVDDSTVISEISIKVQEAISVFDTARIMIPGKRALSYLNDRIREEYSVSISAASIISSTKAEDISGEFADVLRRINRFLQ